MSADGTGRRAARGPAAGAAARWEPRGAEPRARRTGARARRPRLAAPAPTRDGVRTPHTRSHRAARGQPPRQRPRAVAGRAGEPQRVEPGRPAGGVTCVRESWAAAAMVFPSCTGGEGRTDGRGPGVCNGVKSSSVQGEKSLKERVVLNRIKGVMASGQDLTQLGFQLVKRNY